MWLIKTNISKTYRIKNDRFWLFYLGWGRSVKNKPALKRKRVYFISF